MAFRFSPTFPTFVFFLVTVYLLFVLRISAVLHLTNGRIADAASARMWTCMSLVIRAAENAFIQTAKSAQGAALPSSIPGRSTDTGE